MARFDLIDEFTSVYVPSQTAPPPRRRTRKAGGWTLRLAPFAAMALVAVAIIGW